MNSKVYEEIAEAVKITDPVGNDIKKLPELYLHYSSKLLEAKNALQKNEATLKLLKAEKAIAYRADGTVKSTEASIAEKVANDPAVKVQESNVIDSEAYFEECKAIMNVLDLKKSALSMYVSFLGFGRSNI